MGLIDLDSLPWQISTYTHCGTMLPMTIRAYNVDVSGYNIYVLPQVQDMGKKISQCAVFIAISIAYLPKLSNRTYIYFDMKGYLDLLNLLNISGKVFTSGTNNPYAAACLKNPCLEDLEKIVDYFQKSASNPFYVPLQISKTYLPNKCAKCGIVDEYVSPSPNHNNEVRCYRCY